MLGRDDGTLMYQKGLFSPSLGSQVSCGLDARLDNRLELNVRFERKSERAWTRYTGTVMQYSELMYDAPTDSRADIEARSFLLIFSFEDRGQLPMPLRERPSYDIVFQTDRRH